MNYRIPYILSALVGISLTAASGANCEKTIEALGKKAGATWVGFAQAYVDAGLWDDPNCEESGINQGNKVCSYRGRINKLFVKYNRVFDRSGCWTDETPFKELPESYMFDVFLDAMDSDSAALRFHVLKIGAMLCNDGHLILADHEDCGLVIEKMALATLRTDRANLNRQLALEVLLNQATDQASELIDSIRNTATDFGPPCPKIYSVDGTENVSVTEIHDDYAADKYSCENEIAERVALRIKKPHGG